MTRPGQRFRTGGQENKRPCRHHPPRPGPQGGFWAFSVATGWPVAVVPGAEPGPRLPACAQVPAPSAGSSPRGRRTRHPSPPPSADKDRQGRPDRTCSRSPSFSERCQGPLLPCLSATRLSRPHRQPLLWAELRVRGPSKEGLWGPHTPTPGPLSPHFFLRPPRNPLSSFGACFSRLLQAPRVPLQVAPQDAQGGGGLLCDGDPQLSGPTPSLPFVSARVQYVVPGGCREDGRQGPARGLGTRKMSQEEKRGQARRPLGQLRCWNEN